MTRISENAKILPFPANTAAATRDGGTPAGPHGMRAALKDAVESYADAHGGGEGHFPVAGARLHLLRAFNPSENHYVYQPSLCITLQGGKEILIGDKTLRYGPMQALVVGMDMPACGRVVAASECEPYVGITIEFDMMVMREVLEQLELRPTPVGDKDGRGVFVADVDGSLADCVLRMVRLAHTPKAIPIVLPALMREFYYWLLSGPDGADLCRRAMPDTHLQRISKAIHHLRVCFTSTLRVEQLADVANMSLSSFHQHFKAMTGMTPLQFQKQLRLLEARRLMLSEAMNVAEAAYQVGYESASQFSREYSRAFGVAPKRDTMQLKAAMG